MKLPALFLRFETEEHILRGNKCEISGESALMRMFLKLKITMNKVKMKKLDFRYFCRFGTRALTLRPRNTYIYVFRALFGFCNFQATCCEFSKLGVTYLDSKLNFESIEQVFWRLNVLVCCCAASQYSEITCIFLRSQTEESVVRVNKSEITGENAFSGDPLEIEDKHESIKDEETWS